MKFSELSDAAKAAALEYREQGLCEWWGCTIDSFTTLCKCFGFDVDYKSVYLRGFSSQGDGASFLGTWDIDDAMDCVEQVKGYAPQDETLQELAKYMQHECTLAFGVSEMLTNGFGLRIGIGGSARHNYVHEQTMQISRACGEVLDFDGHIWDDLKEPEVIDICARLDESVLDIAKSLARWLYKALEEEWQYLCSEESLTEEAEANGWDFDEAGSIIFDKEHV